MSVARAVAAAPLGTPSPLGLISPLASCWSRLSRSLLIALPGRDLHSFCSEMQVLPQP